MRMLLLSSSSLALAGCFATGDTREIVSDPPGALVTIDGYGECETPCSIRLDGYRDVTVAKAGYKAQRFGLKPGADPVEVILELAAPAGDVDTTALPALD